MSDIDQIGSFYLGRRHDLANGTTHAEPLIYDSKDLTTHAVCVGMTGSGKTGLCISLLEEAAPECNPQIELVCRAQLDNIRSVIPNFQYCLSLCYFLDTCVVL